MNKVSPDIAPSFAGSQSSDPVLAVVNYTTRGEPKPIVYQYEKPAGAPSIEERADRRRVAIHSARPLLDRLSLDRQGFVLVRGRTAVVDFDDEAERKAVYDPEVAALVTAATGARSVLVFDHTIRRIANDDSSPLCRAPVHVAHNDYTRRSGPQRVRDLLPAREAGEALQRRFAIVNVWRSIAGPVLDTPLALCDAESVATDDLIATDLKFPDRTGEVYRIGYNPAHRWFYVPRLQPDEVILLKSFDSAEDGRARFTPHTAFDDPATAPGAARRQSIESRVLAFF